MSDSSHVLVDAATEQNLLTRINPTSMDILAANGLDAQAVTMVELSAGGELYDLLTAYIVGRAEGVKSFSLGIGRNGTGCCDNEDVDLSKRTVIPSLGLGLHKFVTDSGKTLFALLQTLGEPVGGDCGASLYKSLVIISAEKDDLESIRALAEQLVLETDKVKPSTFTVWRWHVKYNHWMRGQVATARPIESVVLPRVTEEQLLSDLDDFLSHDTRAFYETHGIPHKRSYLFHGAPGAGKTSCIQAIAGRYRRNVCYLTANPEMTDDSLKSAIEHVPHKSIVVLEDVDALFDASRKKKEGDQSKLTFSGLLNALDGVGGSIGQIFILTTNHRERLDPALIRNGRVDCQIEFCDATSEQIRGLFGQFFKDAAIELAAEFDTALRAKLGERTISMAALQSFFISMRRKTAAEAVESVDKIVTELEERAGAHAKKTDTTEKAAAEDKQPTPANNDAGATNQKPAPAGREVHVHVHMHE